MPATTRPAFSTTSIWRFVGAEEETGFGAFDDLARQGVGAAGIEGDSHARRGTIQAGDLIERVIHARGDRHDQTGGLCSDGRAERRQHCNSGTQPLHRRFVMSRAPGLCTTFAVNGDVTRSCLRLAIITSVDLMTARASSPRFSFRAWIASAVTTAVSVWLPTRSLTCASRPSMRTSSTKPSETVARAEAGERVVRIGRVRSTGLPGGLRVSRQAIDFGIGNPVMAALGERRADAAVADPPLHRRIADAELLRCRTNGHQCHDDHLYGLRFKP